MPAPPTPRQNHLLAALPQAVYERLLPNLELVTMPLGQVMYTSGSELPYLYFPTTCIVSLVYVMANGASAEIAVTGYEGLLGVSLFLGGDTTPNQAVVQSGGHAYRIGAKLVKHEFDQGGPLQRLLLLYTQALIAQMAQTAVCNRHHSLDKQLCRWLLLSLDRLRSVDDDAGIDRQHARRTAAGGCGGGRKSAEIGLDRLSTRPHQSARSPGARSMGLRVLCGRQT